MNNDCGCCTGITISTPAPTDNRPGLNAISYRAGRYASFFETMRARMSGAEFPELAALKTRDASDSAIGLLDAWAVTADVLTFYQERIANEGYLRTATERRSVLELARLIGYQPRPGVSATTYLAYEIDQNSIEVEIPEHTRAQSVPGPGEQMQTFETAELLTARHEWNAIKPRMRQPQRSDLASVVRKGLYLQGTTTQLKPNDALLIVGKDASGKEIRRPYRVEAVVIDPTADFTKVTLRAWIRAQQTFGHIARSYSVATDFDVAPSSQTYTDVLKIIEPIDSARLESDAALNSYLTDKALPALQKQLDGLPPAATKLRPWIGGLLAELKRAHDAFLIDFDSVTAPARDQGAAQHEDKNAFEKVIGKLEAPPSTPPRNKLMLKTGANFDAGSDIYPQLLQSITPNVGHALYNALATLKVTDQVALKVYALRTKAALFASNAPSNLVADIEEDAGHGTRITYTPLTVANAWPALIPAGDPKGGLPTIALDAIYDQIKSRGSENVPSSYALIDRPGMIRVVTNKQAVLSGERVVTLHQIDQADTVTMAAGLSFTGKVTQLSLDQNWLAGEDPSLKLFALDPDTNQGGKRSPSLSERLLRGTQVYAQSEQLPLADETIFDDIDDPDEGASQEIELDTLYDGLKPGRWMIITGERTDIPATAGVPAAELAMLASVRHGVKQIGNNKNAVNLDGDNIHTFITLANRLAYAYRRDTVTLYGNVVKANHGETRREVLGSGDATQPLQQFTLKQPPLTFVAAPTPSGVASTLEVRVNDVRWHEADALFDAAAGARNFMSARDDDEKTAIQFGDGKHGARLPTGQENIKAIYRNGIGKAGNVRAAQIALATDKPLGIKGVTNPLPASAGADRDTRDQARRNAPLAVMALDRLVSVQDYADFARTFAGIGKAAAVRLTDGHRQFVHVTIAGVDDIPIDESSDLFHALTDALRRYGDPQLPVRVQARQIRPLVIRAGVTVAPDYSWEIVAPKIRAALLDAFGFDRRELGEDVLKSVLVATMQGVTGVLYSNVTLGVLDTKTIIAGLAPLDLKKDGENPAKLLAPKADAGSKPTGTIPEACKESRIAIAMARAENGNVFSAEIAYLLPDVPDTLLLELKS